MPRVKGGYVTRRRRKAVLKLAKGFFGSKHALYRTAHSQVMRSMQYAFRDRKQRKRQFRRLWIQRINAACQLNDIKYNKFINGLTMAGVIVNRKMLAEMAVNDAEGFAALVEVAKKSLANPVAKEVEKTVFLKAAPKAERSAAAKAEMSAPKAAKAEAPKAEKKAAKKVEAPKAAPQEDLNSKTVAELKEMAKAAGITGISAMKKADLIAALTK